jgi:hypothetical protein
VVLVVVVAIRDLEVVDMVAVEGKTAERSQSQEEGARTFGGFCSITS